jgi:hypothetical protein
MWYHASLPLRVTLIPRCVSAYMGWPRPYPRDPCHPVLLRAVDRGTIFHAERAGVLEAVLGIGAGGLSLPGIGKGSTRALHQPTEGREVISLVLIEVPTQAWGLGARA